MVTYSERRMLPSNPHPRVGVFRYTVYVDEIGWMAEIITHGPHSATLKEVGGGRHSTLSAARKAADEVLV